MEKPQIRRIYRQFTPEERERWLKARAEIEHERPEFEAKHLILVEAANEPTVSGIVRRAVHRTGIALPQVAKMAGLAVAEVHEFLRGERTLRSDVLDRLGKAAGLEFPPEFDEAKKNPTSATAPMVSLLPMTSTPAPSSSS